MIVIITILLIVINVLPTFLAKQAEKPGNGKRNLIIALACTILLVFGIQSLKPSVGNGNRPFEGQTLHIYNVGEYTGENIISNFEELTGAEVIMEIFDSNEAMYIKVANGETYDILVPSDYMIQRLIEENLLQPLDYELLDCMDLLVPEVLNLSYDPNNVFNGNKPRQSTHNIEYQYNNA